MPPRGGYAGSHEGAGHVDERAPRVKRVHGRETILNQEVGPDPRSPDVFPGDIFLDLAPLDPPLLNQENKSFKSRRKKQAARLL